MCARVVFWAAAAEESPFFSNVRVDSCSGGTSQNQCNNAHVGFGPIRFCSECTEDKSEKFAGPCVLPAPSAARYHFDHCEGMFCWGAPTGSDTYSVGPFNNGYRVVNFSARVSRCGNVTKEGNWEAFVPIATCTLSIRKANPEDDRGTFIVDWRSPLKHDVEYVMYVSIEGPDGLAPW